jgi:methionyl-tRNA formyltransferase
MLVRGSTGQNRFADIIVRLLFFGDGAWAANSLRRIAAWPWSVGAVVLRRRPSSETLAETARALGLPILQPGNVNSPEFLEIVRSFAPDLNLSVSYDQIVRRPLLDAAPRGFINFHAGKLPHYRGKNVVNWALINGETEIGITGHFMDEGIDTGDILLQHSLPIGWTDTYGDVLDRVIAAFPDLVEATLGMIADDTAVRRRQAHLPGTYFAARREGDEWLDWSDTSRNLHNKVRAITRPGPGALTMLGDAPIVVWRALWDPSWPAYLATPGEVVGRRADGVIVKTGDSTLLLLEAGAPGHPAAAPVWPPGTRLGAEPDVVLLLLRRIRALEEEFSSRRTP